MVAVLWRARAVTGKRTWRGGGLSVGHNGQVLRRGGGVVSNDGHVRAFDCRRQWNVLAAVADLVLKRLRTPSRRRHRARRPQGSASRTMLGKEGLRARVNSQTTQCGAGRAGVEAERSLRRGARLGAQWGGVGLEIAGVDQAFARLPRVPVTAKSNRQAHIGISTRRRRSPA